MVILFLDMEWGQVYGSYRRDFIPIEIGAVISGFDDGPVLAGKKFCPDINLVIRRNIIDSVANTIGFSQTVANVGQGEYQKHFDPSYRLRTSEKVEARKLSHAFLRELRHYIGFLFKQYHITHLVLFGGLEDLNLLRKANLNLSHIEIIDIQRLILKETRYLFSLDKISLVTGFYFNSKVFGSTHFQYPLPQRYKYLIKPHRAIGDACRTFLVYKEFAEVKPEFVQRCSHYLQVNRPHHAIAQSIAGMP